MQILYGAMKESELMTIKQAEYIREKEEKREKMSEEAKVAYKMSRTEFLPTK